jgi:hypothetical protein
MVGSWIQNNLVFPFSHLECPFKKDILQRENWISNELFWKGPFHNVRYPKQQEIQTTFDRYDQWVIIESQGKQIRVKCRVIETKGCPKEGALNHCIIQGNNSTLDNNTPGIYPFLEAYLKEKEKYEEFPPGRFILLSHYDNTVCDSENHTEEYYPGDMHEWGFVFKKTLESLVNQYGELDLLAAHSLGNIPVVESLKYIKDEEFVRLFPRTLLLAQGPSSLKEVSKNMPFSLGIYPWGWCLAIGLIVYLLAQWTGWNIEIDQTLVERLKSLPKEEDILKKLHNSHIVITEVYHDYFFPERASLCASEKLEELRSLTNLYRMTFNPPLSWEPSISQHSYPIGLLQRQDLIKESLDDAERNVVDLKDPKKIIHHPIAHEKMLRHGENLVEAVLRATWSEKLCGQGKDLAGRVCLVSPSL